MKSDEAPIEIKRLNELEPSQPIAILVYGGSGAGKTFLLGTGGDRCLFIDCGIGPLETLMTSTFKKKVGANPIVVRVREQFDDDLVPLGRAYDTLCDIIDYALESMSDQFDWVCVDNATALRKFSMTKGVLLSGSSGKSQTSKQLSGGESTVTIGSKSIKVRRPPIITPAVQDYGQEMELVEWFCATYIDLLKRQGKNFVLSAHERREYKKPKDNKGRLIIGEPPSLEKIRPGFTGQTFPDDIPALFDEVWYIEGVATGQGTVHRIKPHPEDGRVAKTTFGSGVLSSVETNPNLNSILDRIRASWAQGG